MKIYVRYRTISIVNEMNMVSIANCDIEKMVMSYDLLQPGYIHDRSTPRTRSDGSRHGGPITTVNKWYLGRYQPSRGYQV